MAKHYNFIYEELVRYEGDLVGRVAYSLYKGKDCFYRTIE